MSRINIIIIGLLSSIFLIFLCISLHTEKYYEELNPKKVKNCTKRLNPKPSIPLTDRQNRVVELKKAPSLSNSKSVINDKNLTLIGSKKNILLENQKRAISLEKNRTIYPISEYNSSSTISNSNKKTSIPKISQDEIQMKISTLLKNRPINFKKNSGEISQKGKKILDDIFILILLEQDEFMVEVQGHTDAGGKRKVNQWISQKRANRVRSYLIKKGIPSKNIKAEGFGESKLLFIDKPYSQKNRRVEVYIKRR